jgi:hypothetical protein
MYAKPLTFRFEDQEISLELGSSVKKEELYGKKTTTVEKDQAVLEKVLVTPEGEIIEVSNTRSIKVDPSGSLVEETQPISNETGQAVFFTSSFKEARLMEKAHEQDLVSLSTESVYPVGQTNLEAGIYKTKFAYRDGPKLQDAILLVNSDKPSFLLVGEAKPSALIGPTETYEFFDAEDETADSDEMSFEMF